MQSDYTPSRSRTPGSEGGVRMHAQRIFTVSDEDVEDMLKTKVKGASKVGFCGVMLRGDIILAVLAGCGSS